MEKSLYMMDSASNNYYSSDSDTGSETSSMAVTDSTTCARMNGHHNCTHPHHNHWGRGVVDGDPSRDFGERMNPRKDRDRGHDGHRGGGDASSMKNNTNYRLSPETKTIRLGGIRVPVFHAEEEQDENIKIEDKNTTGYYYDAKPNMMMPPPPLPPPVTDDGLVELLICPICRDFMIQATVTSCGHTFCAACLSTWLKVKAICPLCSQPITFSSERDYVKDLMIEKVLSSYEDQGMLRMLQLLHSISTKRIDFKMGLRNSFLSKVKGKVDRLITFLRGKGLRDRFTLWREQRESSKMLKDLEIKEKEKEERENKKEDAAAIEQIGQKSPNWFSRFSRRIFHSKIKNILILLVGISIGLIFAKDWTWLVDVYILVKYYMEGGIPREFLIEGFNKARENHDFIATIMSINGKEMGKDPYENEDNSWMTSWWSWTWINWIWDKLSWGNNVSK